MITLDTSLLSIGKTAKILGVTLQTLRRWDKSGVLKPTMVTSGGHRYYALADLEFMSKNMVNEALQWAVAGVPLSPPATWYCESKESLRVRVQNLEAELGQRGADDALRSFLVTSVSEIGNNAFDHNLGNWPDIRGVFFGHDIRERTIVIADRGLGILETLKRVKPELSSSVEALTVACNEILSGRAPEPRGNGLKYVKEVTRFASFEVRLASGDAEITLREGGAALQSYSPAIRGAIAFLKYRI